MDGANTAWILTSTALVLFMTLPGLALLIWRSGSIIERVVSLNALFCDRLRCIDRVARHWLSLAFADGNAWAGGFRKLSLPVSVRRLCREYTRERVLYVPNDIRDHHAGAHRRRVSASFGAVLVFSALGSLSFTPR